MKKQFKRPYKDDANLDKEFPDSPFNQRMFDEIKLEVDELRKREVDGGPTIRDAWIVKHQGGRWSREYGLAVRPEAYKRLSKKWDEFTEWSGKRDYAEGKRMEQYDEMAREQINKL